MTYQQAYNKIIEAYFKDEIEPWDAKFCFCGTLCNGKTGWNRSTILAINKNDPHNDYGDYLGIEYTKMERALLEPFNCPGRRHNDYEAALFEGMCAALDVLKEIHRSRGENVDEVLPAFTKRQLQKV